MAAFLVRLFRICRRITLAISAIDTSQRFCLEVFLYQNRNFVFHFCVVAANKAHLIIDPKG